MCINYTLLTQYEVSTYEHLSDVGPFQVKLSLLSLYIKSVTQDYTADEK